MTEPRMTQNQLDDHLEIEAAAMTRTLASRGINAGTKADWAMVCGGTYLYYQLQLGGDENIDRIEKRLGEIDEALYGVRGEAVVSRLRRRPLGIEVPHPRGYALKLAHGLPILKPQTMLAGREYKLSGPVDFLIDLTQTPHLLVPGITGAGKSVMLFNLIASLCFNTSPEDVEIHVIDLKNEEGADLAKLPHVRSVATDIDAAKTLVNRIHEIKEDRVRGGRWRGPRLILIVDELAELMMGWPGAATILGRLASIGRSKGITLIAATQKPNKESVGSILKANFPMRLLGMVGDINESYQAGGRKQLGAELLPGNGSFLVVGGGGNAVPRIQAYYIEEDELDAFAREIRAKWYGVEGVDSVSLRGASGGGRGARTVVEVMQPPATSPPVTMSAAPLDNTVAHATLDNTVAHATLDNDMQPDITIEHVVELLRDEFATSKRPVADLRAIARFVVGTYYRVIDKEWSKADMIRQAYGRGLISSSVTGGGNARLFAALLVAARAAIGEYGVETALLKEFGTRVGADHTGCASSVNTGFVIVTHDDDPATVTGDDALGSATIVTTDDVLPLESIVTGDDDGLGSSGEGRKWR